MGPHPTGLICDLMCVCIGCSVMSNSLQPHELSPTRLLRPWEFSRQKHWNELPFPSSGDPPDPEIEPGSPALLADSLPSEPQGSSSALIRRGDLDIDPTRRRPQMMEVEIGVMCLQTKELQRLLAMPRLEEAGRDSLGETCGAETLGAPTGFRGSMALAAP